MSTLLQLVNFARQESGVLGADLTSLTGVADESLRFKNWVIRAWEEIQETHQDWKWMRTSYSFTTTANDGSYTSAEAGIATRFGYWDRTYCTVYLTASGVNDQTKLEYIDYDTFRCHYLTGTQTNQRPLHWTIGDSNELLLGPAPESTLYTVAGRYYKSAQTLSADADEPELPEQHKVIAYKAVEKYGFYEAAPDQIGIGRSNYTRIMGTLTARYRPMVELAGPLT
jgi:hypothetical protein